MRRKITTIGIICIIIAMIIEIWLENYYSLIMVIPLLYLINIRKHLWLVEISDMFVFLVSEVWATFRNYTPYDRRWKNAKNSASEYFGLDVHAVRWLGNRLASI